MAALDPATEELFLGIALALFVNRLHVLRLTEVCRLGMLREANDANAEVTSDIDRQLANEAFPYAQRRFPAMLSGKIEQANARWIRLAYRSRGSVRRFVA